MSAWGGVEASLLAKSPDFDHDTKIEKQKKNVSHSFTRTGTTYYVRIIRTSIMIFNFIFTVFLNE